MGNTTAMSARSLQYYVIANRWASDIEFSITETFFFYHLIDEYFIRLCDPAHVKTFQRIMTDLSMLEIDRNKADRLLTSQLKHLELMAEDIIPEDIDSLSGKQIQLEYMMTGLLDDYREVKCELFALVGMIRKIKSN
jgi:hypothetical protein